MQRTTKLSTKQKSSQTAKDSRQTSEAMVITKGEDIMVKVGTMVEEAITTNVDTKIIMEEDLDVGYAIKITISTHNVHTKIGLT